MSRSIFFILAFLASLLPTTKVYAVAKLTNPVSSIMKPNDLIDILVTIIQLLGGPIVVIGILYAGYKLVSAQGETNKLEEGRRALLWVIVGATIILGATVLKEVVSGTINALK